MQPQSPQPSDAIWTVPNVLTFIRLGLTPLFLFLALGQRNIGGAFAAAFTGLITDLADGRIARRFGQISRLGIVLDPLADRLALLAAALVLIVHDLAPLPLIIAAIARDLALLLVGLPVLRARRVPIPPVSRLGKVASFGVSLAFGTYLAAAIPGIETPWLGVRTAATVLAAIWVPAYYLSAFGYIRAGLSDLSRSARG